MALKMSSPCLSPFPHFPFSHLPKLLQSPSTAAALSFILYRINPQAYVSKRPGFFYNPFDSSRFRNFNAKAPAGGRRDGITANPCSSGILIGDLLNLVSAAKDANEALEVIGEVSNRNGGFVSTSDCSSIIAAAIERDNSDLALSIFDAMRSSFDPGVEVDGISGRWKWPRPDVHIYILLVQRLAASLRVLEALRVLTDSCRMGVSSGKEVPFGKVVRCPSCMIAITVAQPQHGIQIASCFKCRYKYELVSGGVVSIDSKEMSIDAPAWKRGLSFLQIMKQNIPAAVHSIVVNTPSGTVRTHKFATKTVDLPAQKGERVTIALAAPSSIYTEVGPFKFYPKATNFYPGEPICLTNHVDGRESLLLRAPVENGSSSLLDPSFVIPLSAVLATGDAATGIIDPNLPKFISAAAVAILALGAAINTLVLPQLNRLASTEVGRCNSDQARTLVPVRRAAGSHQGPERIC